MKIRTRALLAVVLLVSLVLARVSAAVPVARAAAPRAPDDPACSVSITLPQSALELKLEFRQLGSDLSKFLEPQGVDAVGLHQLQVMSLLAQGARFTSGVTLRAGSHLFKPGRYPLGFTVSQGGALQFFMVDGTEAIPLPNNALEPGWKTERLSMHLEYVGRTELHLVWHLGERAGSFTFGLGGNATPSGAAPAGGVQPAGTQPAGTPPAGTPPAGPPAGGAQPGGAPPGDSPSEKPPREGGGG